MAFLLPYILKAYEKYHYWLNIELTLNLVLQESTLTICSAVITSHGLCFSFGPQMNQRRSPSKCDRQATLCSIVLSQIIESVLNEWFLRNQCGTPICCATIEYSELRNLFSNWNRGSIINLKRTVEESEVMIMWIITCAAWRIRHFQRCFRRYKMQRPNCRCWHAKHTDCHNKYAWLFN